MHMHTYTQTDIHTYTYIYTCTTHTYIHTHTQIHICAQPAACVFADVYVGVKTHLCNIHTCPCTSAQNTCKVACNTHCKKMHIYICTCARIQARMRAGAHACTCIYARLCICMHIRPYTRARGRTYALTQERLERQCGSDGARSPT